MKNVLLAKKATMVIIIVTSVFMLSGAIIAEFRQQVFASNMMLSQDNSRLIPYCINGLQPSCTIRTVCFEGVVDRVDNSSIFGMDVNGSEVKVGDKMSGRYTYDLVAEDTTADAPIETPLPGIANDGTYTYVTPPNGFAFKLDDHNFIFMTNPSDPLFGFIVVDGIPQGYVDEMLIVSTQKMLAVPLGTPLIEMGLYFINHNGTAISSDDLPLGAPPLNIWNDTRWFVDGPNGGYIAGHLTSDSDC